MWLWLFLCGGEEVKECKSLKKMDNPAKVPPEKRLISVTESPVNLVQFYLRFSAPYMIIFNVHASQYSGIYDTCIWEFGF